MDTMREYQLAQEGFDAVLAKVPADRWDARSACPRWTVRDVAGHVIWGQHQLRAWATGTEYGEGAGAPGAPHPAVLAGDDPVATWRAARESCLAALTDEAFGRIASLPGVGDLPVAAVVGILVTDTLVHTWDIAHGLGMDVRLDPALVTRTMNWARATPLQRVPEFFGPAVTPPDDADEQARLLAYLGRAAWQPVPA
jgi:uncharacterized protein (TIGR03086 family)